MIMGAHQPHLRLYSLPFCHHALTGRVCLRFWEKGPAQHWIWCTLNIQEWGRLYASDSLTNNQGHFLLSYGLPACNLNFAVRHLALACGVTGSHVGTGHIYSLLASFLCYMPRFSGVLDRCYVLDGYWALLSLRYRSRHCGSIYLFQLSSLWVVLGTSLRGIIFMIVAYRYIQITT